MRWSKEAGWVAVLVVLTAAFFKLFNPAADPPESPHSARPPGGATGPVIAEDDGTLKFRVDTGPIVHVILTSNHRVHPLVLQPTRWAAMEAYIRQAEILSASQKLDTVTGTSQGFFQDLTRSGRVGLNIEYSRDLLRFAWNDTEGAGADALLDVPREQWPQLADALHDIDVTLTHDQPTPSLTETDVPLPADR